MKIGKIILLVLGLAIIALGVKGLLGIPGQQAVLEAAVYLDEAVVLPENEGKPVIIHGKPEMLAPVYDEELKLTINSIKAYRYKETYKQTGFAENETKWEWVTNEHKPLTGRAKIGEFELDPDLLAAFPSESDYTDFDPAETKDYVLAYKSAATGEVCVLPHGGYYTDAEEIYADGSYFSWLSAQRAAETQEGQTAYRYKFYDPEKNGEHTVAGIQQGNRLVEDETLGVFVRNGVLTREKLLSANAGTVSVGAAAFMAIGAVLVYLGLRSSALKFGRKKA